MDCSAHSLADLLIMGAAVGVALWPYGRWPPQGQVLRTDQMRRRYPRLRWVPLADGLLFLAWFALFISFFFVANRPFRHPGAVFGGALALLSVARGLLGVLTGAYPLTLRWLTLYTIGPEARRQGMKQALMGLAVLLAAVGVGIWLE